MENMTEYQYAWALYLAGALGCSLAAWLLFRKLGRAVTHFMVITVMVLLFTPYAIDQEKMTMAPGIYTLVFGYLDGGFVVIKPLLKVMLGIWAIAQVLSLIYQMLTRHRRPKQEEYYAYQQNSYEDDGDYSYNQQRNERSSGRGLSREERVARDELLQGEPIRAIR
ncbi:MAG: hypothetical protein B0W54_22800 [Cellvibrio sp. 79]|nr:MAG: hypothetical protein B0W54_22800 [Cellvibrio sp. 79]